jgi:hypothetical protein
LLKFANKAFLRDNGFGQLIKPLLKCTDAKIKEVAGKLVKLL